MMHIYEKDKNNNFNFNMSKKIYKVHVMRDHKKYYIKFVLYL